MSGELDPQLNSPLRLRLTAMLSAVSEAEFALVRASLGISDSVLSKHVAGLVEAGYLRSRKGVRDGRRTTWIGLTDRGRSSLNAHVAALREVIATVAPDTPHR